MYSVICLTEVDQVPIPKKNWALIPTDVEGIEIKHTNNYITHPTIEYMFENIGIPTEDEHLQ
jgi:hypothetical protein